jgi:hypothetical protein
MLVNVHNHMELCKTEDEDEGLAAIPKILQLNPKPDPGMFHTFTWKT